MKRHKWLLTLLLAVFLLGGGAFLLWQTGFFSSVGSLEEMRNYIERFAPYSHLFFFLIQLLSVVIAPIPSNVTALAGAVLFLLNNEAASFITGVCIPIDGGFSAYSGV